MHRKHGLVIVLPVHDRQTLLTTYTVSAIYRLLTNAQRRSITGSVMRYRTPYRCTHGIGGQEDIGEGLYVKLRTC